MKAILVIDIEEDMIGEVDYTILTKGNMSNGRAELKPMPQISKKRIDDLKKWDWSKSEILMYETGFDDCIDEILGEEDGNN